MHLTMKLHRMQLPREVILGNETIELVYDICKKLGFSQSVFMVMGRRTRHILGQRIIDLLDDVGMDTDYTTVDSSTMKNVELVEEKLFELKPQVVLGVGGGTNIDVAKLSSARQNTPFISIPTTASHDGIAGPLASVKGLGKPYSEMAQAPMAIIADTSIISQAPHRFTASGCGDAISKLTAVRDWKLANNTRNEYYGEYAASLALMSAKLVAKNAHIMKNKTEEGVRVLLEALISCGVAMSIAGSSRPCSGSEHLFSHALDVIMSKPSLHGEQTGIGTIMMAYLHKMNWKRIKETLRRVGAPTTAAELSIEPKYIVEALVRAHAIRPGRYTILEEKRLDYDSAEKLAKVTGIIE
ncbi:MAG: NAD(P)-dependent glycerol-1-phosphate dehydrogenase [Candidatus Bathyarchaeota archaeon]|nr:MAG: NAD(P)-dependent glycerol-1-phosphate dehydrogenase [Candidatus Bathyarchaeota archaeon]